MKQALEFINEIFETDITDAELSNNIEDVLEWNSFTIMVFLSEMSDRHQADIGVEELSKIETIEDLLHLVIERRGNVS